MVCSFSCYFFLNDNRMGVLSGSHFQIKMITGWNSSGSHSPNQKINPFSIWTMRTGWVSSSCQFFFKWQPDGVSSYSYIRAILVLKFFIRVQEERIRVSIRVRKNSSCFNCWCFGDYNFTSLLFNKWMNNNNYYFQDYHLF